MMPRKKTTTATTDPVEAVRDTRSDAWRALLERGSAATFDELLRGVIWSAPRAYEAGALIPNEIFAGRGKAKKVLLSRLVAVLALAPEESQEARRLRAEVETLLVDGDGPPAIIDAAALRDLKRLEWAHLQNATSIEGLGALAGVRRLDLWHVEHVDLSALAHGMFERVSVLGGHVSGVACIRSVELGLVGAKFDAPLEASVQKLSLQPREGTTSIGPVAGSIAELVVCNAREGFAEIHLGALPALAKLVTYCTSELSAIYGAEQCGALREARLQGAWREVPPLPETLESLTIEAPLADASGLARLPNLRHLVVQRAENVQGLEVIASLRGLTHLGIEHRTRLVEALRALPSLPELRSLSLRGQPLERVPDLDVDAPGVESLSLEDCRGGFLEHDALARMPSLRQLRLAGSTLDTFKRQVDPKLRAREIEIRFDR